MKKIFLTITYLLLFPLLCTGAESGLTNSAINRGIQYLQNTKESFLGGASILTKEISDSCGNVQLKTRWKEKFEEDLGYISLYQRYFFSSQKFLTQPEIDQIENLEYPADKIMTTTFFCQNFSYENFLNKIQMFDHDGAYNSSHILFALLIAQEQQCFPEQDLTPLITTLVDELSQAQEEQGSPFVCTDDSLDIYAERAYLIGKADYQIEENWINNILSCQQPDGGFFNPHTTALSILTLIDYADTCN